MPVLPGCPWSQSILPPDPCKQALACDMVKARKTAISLAFTPFANSGAPLMKIVAVLGSPRPKGNSVLMAEAFLEVARERGADTEVYLLNQMHIKGCQGCAKCKTESQVCVVEDDLTPVYGAIRGAALRCV